VRRTAFPVPDLDHDRPAVVIKFDRNPLHHGTLGVIRSLGRAGVAVHLVQESRRIPVTRSRYVTSRHAWSDRLTGPGDAVEGLRELARSVGARPVLLPVDDAGAIFLAENADALGDLYDFPRQRPGLPRTLIDKHRLAQTCARIGVPHPFTVRPTTWDELVTVEPPCGEWPLVLKRVAPWIRPSVPNLPATRLIRSRAELAELAERATASDPGLLVQEYIPRAPEQDWFFHGYYDDSGTALFTGTGVKIRSWPAYTGLTVLGRAARNPAVQAEVDRLLRWVGYRGIVDVDLRYDPRTGHYHVLDVNPRLGAQHRLFQSAAGVDVTRAAHLDLTGRAVPLTPPVDDRTFLVENVEPAAARRYMSDGNLDRRTWWRSVRGVDEYAWFAGDDVAPFVAMAIRSFTEGVRNRRFRAGAHSPSFAEMVTGHQ
jgi:D-aspartate ligase